MKKILAAFIPVCVLFGGCSVNFNFGTENASQTQSDETVSEVFTTSQIEISTVSNIPQTEKTTVSSIPQTEITTESSIPQTEVTAAVNSPTEEELRRLIDDNTYCNLKIFMGHLPLENKDYMFNENDAVQQVDTEVFGSYSEFEDFIRSVYCKETADMYLYDYPYEGDPEYLNIDGDLYVNILYSGEKGYYVDWTNYTVTIDYADETECRFTVKASVEYPAENPVPEDYIIESKAVFENGKWLLSKMIY